MGFLELMEFLERPDVQGSFWNQSLPPVMAPQSRLKSISPGSADAPTAQRRPSSLTHRFHNMSASPALIITSVSDRSDRRRVIRLLGQDIYEQHGTMDSLFDLMQSAIDARPDLEGQLLGDFNSALNGIGHWRC